MQTALAPLSAFGGDLIVTLDFFRWGAKYYKVTEKVDAEPLDAAGIAPAGPSAATGADEVRGPQPEDPTTCGGARRPQAQQHPGQAHRAGLHQQADRLRQLLHRRQPAAAEEIVGTINYYSRSCSATSRGPA